VPGLEHEIRRRVARLRTYHPSIRACRVQLRQSDRHHKLGSRFEVRLDLSVPERRHLLVSHVPSVRMTARREGKGHLRKTDEVRPDRRYALVAVREAFDVARRRLQDIARRQRGDVKRHAATPRGHVVRLMNDHGFIEAPDGHEVYFHRASVLGRRFKDLAVGRQVTFVEERGDQGPQASTVRLVR
jgi:cold shock CspA family protein